MRNLLKQGRPSPAMIVAVVALIVALSGTAVAAKKLGLNKLSFSAKQATVGVGALTYVQSTVTIPPTGTNGLDIAANCPAGTKVIGGGVKVSNDPAELVNDSDPVVPSGWSATVINSSTINHTATITAICAVATN
jgi:energy-coupling factor transporter transmembrane protein EcfT